MDREGSLLSGRRWDRWTWLQKRYSDEIWIVRLRTCKKPWFMIYYRQITEMRTRLGINFFRDGIILGINFFWEIFLCTLHNKNVKSKSQSRFQRFVKNLTKRSYAGLVGIILGINFFKCWYREFEKNSVFLL